MKTKIEVNGQVAEIEGTVGEIYELLNYSSKKKEVAETPDVVTANRTTRRKRRTGASEAWTEAEVMRVVQLAKTISPDAMSAGDIIAKQLRTEMNRTHSSILNAGYRLWQYVHGKTDGRGISNRVMEILDKNGVSNGKKQEQEETIGFLGRVNARGIGQVPVREA